MFSSVSVPRSISSVVSSGTSMFNAMPSSARMVVAGIAGLYAASFLLGDLSYYMTVWMRKPAKARALTQIPNYLPFGLERWISHVFFRINSPYENCLEEIRRHGSSFVSRAMLGSWDVIVTDPEDVQWVLAKNFDNYVKGENMRWVFEHFLGEGIFNVNGAQWMAHRKMAKGQFEKIELANMIPTFWKHLGHLSEHLKPGQVSNMQDLLFRFTLDSVGQILFGTNVNSLAAASQFALAFDRIQNHVIYRAVLYPFTLFYTPPEYHRDIDQLNQYCDQLVSEALADTELPSRHDLLAEYMKSEIDGKPPTRQYLIDMLKNMLIAGRDTTAVLLTWTLYELSAAPHVVENILAEIKQVVAEEGDVDANTPPSQAFLAKLKYMKQVFNEVLRLHPSVPTDNRTAVVDDVLPSGVFVPAGTDVEYPIYVINRLEKYWGSDCLQFDPSRWNPGSERLKNAPPILHSLFFNSGPRMCLGQHMAYSEAKTAILYLFYLKKFRFDVVDRDQVKYFSAIILSAKGGLHCRVSLAN